MNADGMGAQVESEELDDHPRRAVIFSRAAEATYKQTLNEYTKFLAACDFKVTEHNNFNDIQSFESEFQYAKHGPSLQQVIFLFILNRSHSCHLKEALEYMSAPLNYRTDQLLIFCRVLDPEGKEPPTSVEAVPKEERDLVRSFNETTFQFQDTIIAYKAGSSENVSSLFKHLEDLQRRDWREKGVYEILWKDFTQCTLNIRQPSHCREFRREILTCIADQPIQPNKQDRADASPTLDFSSVKPDMDDSQKKNAFIIYTNRRYSKPEYNASEIRNPRALIILNINPKDLSRLASLLIDVVRLQKLFCALKYDVRYIQTDAADEKDLEGKVQTFSKDTDHGDSCILAVISQVCLSQRCLSQLYEHLAKAETIAGKPRLFIVYCLESAPSPENGEDCRPPSALTDLPEFFEQLRVKETTKMHPSNGMICCFTTEMPSTTDNNMNGSHFINAFCDVAINTSHSHDIVSMSLLINKKFLNENVPVWCFQSVKLFFISNTGEAATKAEGISLQEITSKPNKDFAERSGTAIILAQDLFQEVRHFQIFLEYASFEVYLELFDGTIKAVSEAVEKIADKSAFNLALIIYRYHANCCRLEEVIKKISDIQLTQSFLLIYLEVVESGAADQIIIPDAELPAKFSVAHYRGPQADIVRLLNQLDKPLSLLERSTNSCTDSTQVPIAGSTEPSDSEPRTDPTFRLQINDADPAWRKTLTLPNAEKFLTALQRMGKGAEKEPLYFTKAISFSSEARKRALLVNNLKFTSHGARYGSEFDCQALINCLSKLSYRVSVRSNLTGSRVLEEVENFVNSKDHGDSCVLVFMSHGEILHTSGTDGNLVKEADILKPITASTVLKGKQKLVVFQHCRDGKTKEKNCELMTTISDTIIAHSTSPDNYSIREQKGSRFIQSLCQIIDKYGAKYDVLSLVTPVNFLMMKNFSDKYSQLPWWLVKMKEEIYLGQRPSDDRSSDQKDFSNLENGLPASTV